MTDIEKREAARQFYQKWVKRGKEDEDDRSYWIDILSRIMGMENVTDHIEFQKKVIVDGHTKRIDAYLPDTKVLIEQKSLGIDLDKKIHQSGGIDLTPYEQAKRYNDNLPYDEKARWIVTSNFSEIWIYDMNVRVPKPVKLEIINLQTQYTMLDFLIDQKKEKVNLEMELSLKAGEIVGKLYDAFLEQYEDPESPETLKSLNKLCVRIVFCLYSEDAGLFGRKNMFHDYLAQFDSRTARKGLRALFRVLNQKPEERDKYIYDDDPILAAFPYVNGGLFVDEEIEIPPFTDEILQLILKNASDDFNWANISPTIFGAVFESTLNPETRRTGGMHYTSLENIHKVIDPLFLDELKAELASIKKTAVYRTKNRKLQDFQQKLSSLKWMDPAAGSGNFLTETYICIRRLENEVIKELQQNQITFGFEEGSPIQVSINQFYGIEINDFAVKVAKTALWIAESQMMKETEAIVHMHLDFLPLTTNANIVEGNALRINWEDVIPKNELNYIMGNPPFVARAGRTKKNASSSKGMLDINQKEDRFFVFQEDLGNVDYVACWFKKASLYTQNTKIKCAFVATDSICQGQQIYPIWNNLLKDGVVINFAYKFFKWESEANDSATVYVVIVGFSHQKEEVAKLFTGNEIKTVKHISPYLIPAKDILVSGKNKPLCNVPQFKMGNQPIDQGNYLFDKTEKDEFIMKEPSSAKYFKKWLDGAGFLNNKVKYCLWLGDCSPAELKKMPECLKLVKKVQEYRKNSTRKSTQKLAEKPTRFQTENMPSGNYIAAPEVSSGNRRYIPMDFLNSETLCSNKLRLMEDATLYHFGVLQSNVHMAWTRTVCGYYGPSYQYSINIVYNNFPWPSPTQQQKEKIKITAQAILDARDLYPDSSLSDLYDPLTMPPELRKAHQRNDIAVMNAYGFDIKNTSEEDCVAKLMEMYQQLTQ